MRNEAVVTTWVYTKVGCSDRGARSADGVADLGRGAAPVELVAGGSTVHPGLPAERLGEGGGIPKHVGHGRDSADIPRGQVLVEGVCRVEHLVHLCDSADVPRGQVLVEGFGIEEHYRMMRRAGDKCEEEREENQQGNTQGEEEESGERGHDHHTREREKERDRGGG